jgi:glycosyltransferase involved in cell wall biosynthesis
MGERPLRVAYILKMFPRLSETFILNEVLALERQGVDVSAYSLMIPNEGRFHGRLSELRLTVDNVPADRSDRHWEAIRKLPDDLRPPMARWEEAADFLTRYTIPKDLNLLLRAVVIAGRCKRAGVEHVHAHFATIATRMAALVNMLTGIPFSFTSHAKDIFRETVDRRLYKELVDRAAFCVTVSEFNREFILERTPGVDADKVVRLYNGIDLGFFTPPTSRPQPQVPHAVSVGRLVPKKGFPHLLQAVKRCKDAGQPLRLSVVGGGEQEAALHALRDQLGLQDEVTFTGALPQEQVRALLAEASFMVLACVPDPDGNMDALPTVLLEALALDLPVVTTTLTGCPEIVGDEAGVLVPPGDEQALAEGIQALWKRVQDGEVQPGVARARAERLFDLHVNAGQTLRDMFLRSARGA